MIIKVNVYFDIEGKWKPDQVQIIQGLIEMFFTEEVLSLNGPKVQWKIKDKNESFNLGIIKGKILTRQQATTKVKQLIKPMDKDVAAWMNLPPL